MRSVLPASAWVAAHGDQNVISSCQISTVDKKFKWFVPRDPHGRMPCSRKRAVQPLGRALAVARCLHVVSKRRLAVRKRAATSWSGVVPLLGEAGDAPDAREVIGAIHRRQGDSLLCTRKLPIQSISGSSCYRMLFSANGSICHSSDDFDRKITDSRLC